MPLAQGETLIHWVPQASRQLRGKPERFVHRFYEVAFLAEDAAQILRHHEVCLRLWILSQPRLIALVRIQAVECDQAPAHIVRPLVWKEIANQMAAATRDDAAPVLRILSECIALIRIDLVTDDARDNHGP